MHQRIMADIEFCKVVASGDPAGRPVTFIGKKTNLSKVPFASVLPYLGNKVNEEVYSDDGCWSVVATSLHRSRDTCTIILISYNANIVPCI